MMVSEQQSSFAGPTNSFGISANDAGPQSVRFDSNTPFGKSQQQGMYQHAQNGSILGPNRNPSNFQIPEATSAQEMGDVNGDEEFWQQMNKGRTGLTPGLNLDELFGSDGGWNPGYMDQGLSRTQ